MDALEGIGQTGGYRRELIEVQRILDDRKLRRSLFRPTCTFKIWLTAMGA